MSPGDLVKVSGFGRSVFVISVCAHDVAGCNSSSQIIVVQLGLVEDAGLRSRSSIAGLVGGVQLVVSPLCVLQESGFQRRVQRKEGLDQLGLRLWMEGRVEKDWLYLLYM